MKRMFLVGLGVMALVPGEKAADLETPAPRSQTTMTQWALIGPPTPEIKMIVGEGLNLPTWSEQIAAIKYSPDRPFTSQMEDAKPLMVYASWYRGEKARRKTVTPKATSSPAPR